MPLSRRIGHRLNAAVWPGFVDAMTGLLLVLTFVIGVFMLLQFVLRETITGQASELSTLSSEITALMQTLGLEQQRSSALRVQVDELQTALSDTRALAENQATLVDSLRQDVQARDAALGQAQARIAALQQDLQARESALEQAESRITAFEAQVVALMAQRDRALGLAADLEDTRAALVSEQQALNLALAQARDEIDAQAEAARLAAARRAALQALIADLRAQEAALAQQLAEEEARGGALAQRLAAEEARGGALAQRLAAEEARGGALAQRLAAEEARGGELAQQLSEEEAQRLIEAEAARVLRARLAQADTELTAMTLALEEQRKRAEETLTLLAAAEAARDRAQSAQQAAETAQQTATNAAQTAQSEAARNAELLAQARTILQNEQAQSNAAQRQVALLNQQLADLRRRLGELQALLDDGKERDAQQQVQVENLTADLNNALARVALEERNKRQAEEAQRAEAEARLKAEEELRKLLEARAQDLEKYRSEFFGQLRDVFEQQEGVRIVGDRFVFSSEVLFEVGEATLSEGGQRQIKRVVDILRGVDDRIPAEIDWVLQVDGHTDDTPLRGGGAYADNWELSQARALSVVRYMVNDLGMAPGRLSANGFGQYQPIDQQDSPLARARNRRIELKFTEK
ncbi:MAG: peptidoglycan -binding protein [Rhodobacteraceae bacterium]|nr:peptidoglycan -binding protein [Paracoccaceae bacterium]